MEFLPQAIDDYSAEHTTAASELLNDLDRQTNLKILIPRMLSGHIQGRVLSMMSHMVRPMNILEVGTYTGYSAICLAEGMQDGGTLVTMDVNEELEDFTRSFIDKSPRGNQIDFRIGNAIDIIPTLELEWDMVFIDADKDNYANYYDLVIDRVRPGGWIIADNVLWSGKVIEDIAEKDTDTRALKEYSAKIQADPRVENLLLAVRDGLMVARKL